MRIALLWNAAAKLTELSVPLYLYLDGFRRLGHDAFLVTTKAAAEGYSGDVVTVDDAAAFAHEAFWRRLGVDAVTAITWHRMPEALDAIGRAGVRCLALGDSDGQFSFRAFPGRTLSEMLSPHRTAFWKLRAAKHWLLIYLRRARPDDRIALRSTELSERVLMPSPGGRRSFLRFLERYGRSDLAARVGLALYPVRPPFLTGPIGPKTDAIIAVGRWESPQKDVGLLVAALRHYFDAGATSEVHIYGSGIPADAERALAAMPRVRCHGRVSPERLAEAGRRARILLMSSRWEGSPIAANEVLALGGTLVAPDVPSVTSLVENGRFGTIAASRSPAALADALRLERERWESGDRDAGAISAHWRPLVSPEAVCAAILGGEIADRRATETTRT